MVNPSCMRNLRLHSGTSVYYKRKYTTIDVNPDHSPWSWLFIIFFSSWRCSNFMQDSRSATSLETPWLTMTWHKSIIIKSLPYRYVFEPYSAYLYKLILYSIPESCFLKVSRTKKFRSCKCRKRWHQSRFIQTLWLTEVS